MLRERVEGTRARLLERVASRPRWLPVAMAGRAADPVHLAVARRWHRRCRRRLGLHRVASLASASMVKLTVKPGSRYPGAAAVRSLMWNGQRVLTSALHLFIPRDELNETVGTKTFEQGGLEWV